MRSRIRVTVRVQIMITFRARSRVKVRISDRVKIAIRISIGVRIGVRVRISIRFRIRIGVRIRVRDNLPCNTNQMSHHVLLTFSTPCFRFDLFFLAKMQLLLTLILFNLLIWTDGFAPFSFTKRCFGILTLWC